VSFACEDESFGIPDIEKFMGESLACLYPEDVLLKPLPSAPGPAYVRPPRSGQGGGRSPMGGRGGGARRSSPRR
jgi:ATP-dependent RNA helicase RhlB